MSALKNKSELLAVLQQQKKPLRQALLFSLVIGLLALAPSFYMLEVYERVVNSRSVMTLLMLTAAVFLAYLIMEMLEWARARTLFEVGAAADTVLRARVFRLVHVCNLAPGPQRQVNLILNDFYKLRDFLSSPAMSAMLDVPMGLALIALIMWIHPVLGVFSLLSAIVQAGIAMLNNSQTRAPLAEAGMQLAAARRYARNAMRNAEVVAAMGMAEDLRRRWLGFQRKMLKLQAEASDRAGVFTAAAKFVQVAAGSLMLGLGAALLLSGMLPAGAGLMLMASILAGRALAPMVQLIGAWKMVVEARQAYQRLSQLLADIPAPEQTLPLPPPQGNLQVEQVVVNPPGVPHAVLFGVSFAVPAGTLLAVIGPSASGKSSLAQALVGVWPAVSGKVRLDGADVYAWDKTNLGPYVGFLPQDVALFAGTIGENIARFCVPDAEKVRAAAELVGLHEFIESLPDGYDTEVGDEGAYLSGGQRQRIGLARAVYGDPRLVVLDEPNASLDEQGELALRNCLQALKSRGVTVVLITHRPALLQISDAILVLQGGRVALFGPRDEVLAAMSGKPAQGSLARQAAPAAA